MNSEYVLKEGETLTVFSGDRQVVVSLNDEKTEVEVDDMRIVSTFGCKRLEIEP
jgi:hypothetical protein